MAEEGWGATAKVQLFDHLSGSEMTGDQRDLLFQAFQIGLCAAAVLGDDFVACAVMAGVCAKWQVNVQRERAVGMAAATQSVQEVEEADLVVELERSRIRGIARPGLIVATDQIGIPANDIEHRDSRLTAVGWILGGGHRYGLDLYQATTDPAGHLLTGGMQERDLLAPMWSDCQTVVHNRITELFVLEE